MKTLEQIALEVAYESDLKNATSGNAWIIDRHKDALMDFARRLVDALVKQEAVAWMAMTKNWPTKQDEEYGFSPHAPGMIKRDGWIPLYAAPVVREGMQEKLEHWRDYWCESLNDSALRELDFTIDAAKEQ